MSDEINMSGREEPTRRAAAERYARHRADCAICHRDGQCSEEVILYGLWEEITREVPGGRNRVPRQPQNGFTRYQNSLAEVGQVEIKWDAKGDPCELVIGKNRFIVTKVDL